MKIRQFLDIHPGSEAIFIDDGSKDGTGDFISRKIKSYDDMLCVGYKHNRGKWGAIIFGTTVATKDWCVLCDADYSVDLSDIDQIPKDSTVVIGNRYHKGNNIPLKRKIPGRVFNFLARHIAEIDYIDSQTPNKMWSNSKEMRNVFLNMNEEGFAGDVEFLRRCDMQHIDVRTIDVEYIFTEGSSVNVRKHAPKMFGALVRIRNNTR
jgi:glycosyltransferase involved in cell wall biosynthesis